MPASALVDRHVVAHRRHRHRRGTPEPQPESFTEEHGRGLYLVAALTTAWGLDVIPGQGKVVWAELPRPR